MSRGKYAEAVRQKAIHKKSIITLLMVCFVSSLEAAVESYYRFVIVTSSFNNIKKYHDNIDSILGQHYPPWAFRLIYIDDASSDKTGVNVEHYLKQWPDRNVTLIKNKTRRGQLANIYDAIHQCTDDEIVVIVDGDDKLIGPHVLSYLNKTYHYNDTWMTYGQFLYAYDNPPPGRKRTLGTAAPILPHIISKKLYRSKVRCGVLTHLRTYYAWLFKQIKLKDLLDGTYFYAAATDAAVMYPLVEMAALRCTFIKQPLYVYTFHGIRNQLQHDLDQKIRKRKAYQTLQNPRHLTPAPTTYSRIQRGSNMSLEVLDDYVVMQFGKKYEKAIELCIKYMNCSGAEIAFFGDGSDLPAHKREVFPSIYVLDNATAVAVLYSTMVMVKKEFLIKNPCFLKLGQYQRFEEILHIPQASPLCLYVEVKPKVVLANRRKALAVRKQIKQAR